MGCLYCRKKIGPLRRLTDRHYCSNDHRKKYISSKSARAVREAEDLYGFEDTHGTSWRAVMEVKPEDKPERRGGIGTSIFVGVSVVVLVLAISQLPMNSGGSKAVSPLPDTNPHPNQGGFGQLIGNMIQSKTAGTLRDDFHTGLGGWEGFRSIRRGLEPDGRRSSPGILTALEAFLIALKLRTRVHGTDRS